MVQLRLNLKLKPVCVAKFCSVMLSLEWGWMPAGDASTAAFLEKSWRHWCHLWVGKEEWALVVWGVSLHPEFPWFLFKPTHRGIQDGYLRGHRCAK